MMLRSVARLLRQLGYKSVLFPSAEAFANHSDFDWVICIVLDIDLGDVSGIALRHRLKEANISVPIIYITGNDRPAVRAAAHQSGCLAYLTKPFSAMSLMVPLHRAATGWRTAAGSRCRRSSSKARYGPGHWLTSWRNTDRRGFSTGAP
jgi:FixJ family two-component response regulator